MPSARPRRCGAWHVEAHRMHAPERIEGRFVDAAPAAGVVQSSLGRTEGWEAGNPPSRRQGKPSSGAAMHPRHRFFVGKRSPLR